MILDKNTKCSGGNKTEAIEKLLAAGAEAGAEHRTGGESESETLIRKSTPKRFQISHPSLCKLYINCDVSVVMF